MKRLLLAALSIVLLGQVLGGTPAQARPKDRSNTLEELGLSPDQKGKLLDILRSGKEDAYGSHRTLMEERGRLFAMYRDYDLNTGKAKDAISRINRLQLEILNASLDRQIGMRKILTAEQFYRLNKAIGPEPIGPERWGDGPGNSRGPRDKKMPQIDLRPGQQEAIEKMWKSQRRESEQAYNEIGRDLRTINSLYDDYRLDDRQARKLIKNINKTQLELLKSKYDRQIQMRKILSEQQFRTLSERLHKPGSPPFGRRHGR
ncbi:MAG: hypothetical protein Q7N50_06595 [Armatimonadota bacterium]|nr:hypothetical protein [Armatimonadota bacterium]